MNVVAIQARIRGLDPQVTPLRHRVPRIGAEVDQNLLDLEWIDSHRT